MSLYQVAGVIGDISSDLTMLEALLTSSVGIPQCTFASYNMDDQHMANFRYLFRTSPGVSSFLDALVEVVTFYGWRRISVIHTMDVPGLIGEKRFSDACEKRGIYVQKVELPILNRGDDGDLTTIVHNAMRRVRATNTRIHILIAQRRVQVPILNLIRNNGLFQKSHVWMTPIDLSDSLNRLENPSDFAGLIMADARWGMPEFPAYNEFVNRWMDLNQTEYPLSGSTRLSWHETYAYTCVQVIAEAYGALVRQTHTITNKTERDFQLGEIKRGRKASEISMGFIGSQWYTTPIGNFTTDTTGIPIINRISIISFQNSTGVYNGKYINGALEMTTPIVFSDGTTTVPRSFPGSEAIVVVLNRDNIIIKSASMSVINHAVSNKYLLRVVAVPVLLTLVPCIIHVFEDYLVPTMVFASDGNYWVACWSTETQLWWNIGIGITPILLDIFGLYLAFKTRNVTKLWNEARAIALTL
ncbi:hypothetical protein BGW38_002764 [Lunasporangiospora selenospora]|uniref:Receptor ligand binding region domain-containing protein n=1 Tax=Lunasporangiospora selenospora TaxID=979761 RepID=A0A9P6G457_9FUNG|nr:hypothetical protein BGW38_002764 [Lunasporangiospora selenospora]